MCEPTTIAAVAGMSAQAAQTTALVIQGATAVAGAGAAISSANQRNKTVAANAQTSLDAYHMKTKAANLRFRQEMEQAANQKDDAAIKTMQAKSTAATVAAGAGVQGADVEKLMADFERSEGMLNNRIDTKISAVEYQNEMDQLAFQSEATSRINSMMPEGTLSTLFKVAEPIMNFGVDYGAAKARVADVEN